MAGRRGGGVAGWWGVQPKSKPEPCTRPSLYLLVTRHAFPPPTLFTPGALRMVRLYRFLHMYYISYIDPTQTRRNDATILHGLLVAKVLLVILVSAALIYCAEYNREYALGWRLASRLGLSSGLGMKRFTIRTH